MKIVKMQSQHLLAGSEILLGSSGSANDAEGRAFNFDLDED